MPGYQIGITRRGDGVLEALPDPRQNQLAENVLCAPARMHQFSNGFRVLEQMAEVRANGRKPEALAFNLRPVDFRSRDRDGVPASAQADADGDVRVQVPER